MNKLTKYALSLGIVTGVIGAIGTVSSFAAAATTTPLTVPTDLANAAMAAAGAQLTDPGTETFVVVIAGLFIVFYIIGRLLGLVPKGRGHR